MSDRAAAVAALYVDHDAPVRAIYINRTGWDTAHYAVADWAVDGITRYHTGAWPLALDLYESGWISAASAQLVRAELLALGQSEATLHEAAEAGVSDGFLAADTASSLE